MASSLSGVPFYKDHMTIHWYYNAVLLVGIRSVIKNIIFVSLKPLFGRACILCKRKMQKKRVKERGCVWSEILYIAQREKTEAKT